MNADDAGVASSGTLLRGAQLHLRVAELGEDARPCRRGSARPAPRVLGLELVPLERQLGRPVGLVTFASSVPARIPPADAPSAVVLDRFRHRPLVAQAGDRGSVTTG